MTARRLAKWSIIAALAWLVAACEYVHGADEELTYDDPNGVSTVSENEAAMLNWYREAEAGCRTREGILMAFYVVRTVSGWAPKADCLMVKPEVPNVIRPQPKAPGA